MFRSGAAESVRPSVHVQLALSRRVLVHDVWVGVPISFHENNNFLNHFYHTFSAYSSQKELPS